MKGSKSSPGPAVKCHKTRKQAVAHLRALMKNVPDAHSSLIADAGSPNIGIRLYLREGERTVDYRTIDLQAITFDRAPPYPIMLQTIRAEGHAGSVLSGVIKAAARFDNVIVAEGYLANNQAGLQQEQLMRDGVLQTWSPDFGNPVIEDIDGIEHLTHAVFIGATAVPFPAIDSAVMELFDLATGEVIMPAPQREGQLVGSLNVVEGELVYNLSAAPTSIVINEAGKNPAQTAAVVSSYLTTTTSANWPTNDLTSWTFTPTLIASAAPSSHFSNPNLDSLQRYVTITEDGRIYTHLADLGNECHVGYSDTCISAPQEPDYSAFTVGTVLTSDGKTIPTGPIALKGGHAEMGLSAQAARAHYDDPSTAVADVAIGTDEFGIWISGSLRPGVTEDQVHALRASGVSGDWRKIGDSLRLIGICSVNVPGFPKLAIAASADGSIDTLVAAGGAPTAHPDDCDCSDNYAELVEELDDLQRLVADAGLEDTVIDRLASRIPADDIDSLYARIT